MIIIDILNKKMSLNEQCKQIRELQSTDEDLAFEQLGGVLRDYMKDYSCDNVFYLYVNNDFITIILQICFYPLAWC